MVAIMGPNASGKTTLVKHFNKLLAPTRGSVMVEGTDTRQSSTAELAHKVGFVFQNPNDHLFADTVWEELAFNPKNLGIDGKKINARSLQILKKLGIQEYSQHYPRSLSGGERQRVALASVLIGQPRILILDEPTRGLDYRLKQALMNLLDEYCRQGNTVILVSHDVEMVAEYAQRVVLLSEGEIVADGEKHAVLSKGPPFSPQINRLGQPFTKYGLPGQTLTVSELMDSLS